MTAAPSDLCPWCMTNLAYDDGGLTFSQRIGVEVQGAVLYWRCPACAGTWHRWREGHELRALADGHIGPLGQDPRSVA